MKKATNLKKRLDELRDEPELPTELTLKIDRNLHRRLKHQADQEQCSLQDYILSVLRNYLDASSGDETGHSK